MRDAEGVPEHDVGIFDALVTMVGHPFRQALRGLARGLGDMATCGMDLVVLVCVGGWLV